MSAVIAKVTGEKSKENIKNIKLIPMLLVKIGTEADY